MKQTQTVQLQQNVIGMARLHFLLVGLFVLTIVLSDAWNLIPPSVVLQRWTIASILLGVTAIVWYAARNTTSEILQKSFVWAFILVDVAVPTVLVFAQRGMASKAVMLYILPLLLAAVLRSRAALVATAALSLAAYSLAVVRYFVTSPGEGYKVELYTELLFYGGLLFVVAGMLWVLVQQKSRTR